MTSRKTKLDKEREKIIQDRLQVLLTQMLKDDDNKYCVDCDSKGPRWASWNLGIFLCIRCAGIHRNLGVHISKVRSVNLDSWTPVQVSSMQLMGNSRARAVYEANLPDGFLRPQNDQALEQFIRAKYERKKYIAKEYVPQKPPDFPEGWHQLIEAEKQKKDIRKLVLPSHTQGEGVKAAAAEETARPKPVASPNTAAAKSPQVGVAKKVAPPVVPKSSAADDLLGLGIGGPVSASASANSEADFLGLGNTSNNGGFDAFVSAPPPANSASNASQLATPPSNPAVNNGTSAKKEEDDFFAQTSSTTSNTQSQANDGKMSKDSIMALFAKSPATSSPMAPQGQGQGQNMFTSPGGANMFSSPNNVQPQRPGGMFGNGATNQPQAPANMFNAQSNPFLTQTATPNPVPNAGGFAAFGNQMGGMSTFGNGSANQMNNVTGGLSCLNLGQGFTGIALDPAANKPSPTANSKPPGGSADILGLW